MPSLSMEKQYSIHIQTESAKFSFLEKGYIKCDVFLATSPNIKQSFIFCLHCSTLCSPSWVFEHKKKVAFSLLRKWSTFFGPTLNPSWWYTDRSRFLFWNWSSLPQRPSPSDPQHWTSLSKTMNSYTPSYNNSFHKPHTHRRSSTSLSKCRWKGRGWEWASNIFCWNDLWMFWTTLFCPSMFWSYPILISFSDGFPSWWSWWFWKRRLLLYIQRTIVSSRFRRVFVKLSLTKNQMDSLNRIIKAILVFTSPSNVKISNQVHSGYLSCLRESTKREDEMRQVVDQSFHQCRFFSMAFDTTLFGQEHVISNIVRFIFEEKWPSFHCF